MLTTLENMMAQLRENAQSDTIEPFDLAERTRAYNEAFASLYDDADHGVSIVDITARSPEEYYLYLNNNYAETCGFSQMEMYAKGYKISETYWQPMDRPVLYKAITRFYERAASLSKELAKLETIAVIHQFKRNDGRQIMVSQVARVIGWALNGAPKHVLIFMNNLTEKDAVDLSLQQLHSQQAIIQYQNISERFSKMPIAAALSQGVPKITPAEINVGYYIVAGYSTRDISKTLGISYKTAEKHRLNIRRHLNLPSQSHLANELLSIVSKHSNQLSSLPTEVV